MKPEEVLQKYKWQRESPYQVGPAFCELYDALKIAVSPNYDPDEGLELKPEVKERLERQRRDAVRREG